jgi:hypothetical protein
MNTIRILSIAAALVFVAIVASAQNRRFGLKFLVSIDNKYGFMDANCQMVIPAQYAEAFDFTEGLASVKPTLQRRVAVVFPSRVSPSSIHPPPRKHRDSVRRT